MTTKDFLKAVRPLLDSVSATRMDSTINHVDVPMLAANHAVQSVAMDSAGAVQAWVEETDMDEGEGECDRFMAMLVGIADADKNGELTEDEMDLIEASAQAAADYMASMGASEEDIDAMFNGEDSEACNAAAARIKSLLVDALPDGAEAASNAVDDFAFGGSQESVFDAVYKKKFAIRKGRKVVIRKRISGVVRLSAKQKMAVRKMHMKSNNAKARLGRMKSMRVAKSMGMGR